MSEFRATKNLISTYFLYFSDYLFKVALLGDPGVGNSSLSLRFAEDTYTESYISTDGVNDFKIRTIELDGKTIKLQIWDTTGADPYRMKAFFRTAHIFLVVYDVTNPESFYNTKEYLNWIDKERSFGAITPTGSIPRKILVGNKSDLSRNRVIRTKQGKDFADKTPGMQFFETSAKASTNVDELFLTPTLQLIRHCEENKKKIASEMKIQAEKSCKMAC